MKRLIVFLTILLFCAPVFAQSVKDTSVRIRDNTDKTMMVDVQAYAATLAATIRGNASLSVGYFLDTVAGVPQVLSGLTATIAPAAMPTAPWNLGLTYFYDLDVTAPHVWSGREMDIDTIPDSVVAPYVGSFSHGWHPDDARWERLILLDPADGIALSNHGLMTSSAMLGYNGATLDMIRVGASKEVQMTDVATRPGEDSANDLRKVSKVDTGTYAPAKTTTATVGTAAVVVLASIEILDLPNVCIFLHNTDGADPFTDANVFVSPDGTTWVDLAWTSCNSLAHGEMCVFCVSGNAYRYIKAEATAIDANAVSVDAWMTGNKN